MASPFHLVLEQRTALRGGEGVQAVFAAARHPVNRRYYRASQSALTASAHTATTPNRPTHSPAGTLVSAASWSASVRLGRLRRRARCSSSTGRTPPNSRNHVSAQQKAYSASAEPRHRTTAIAAPVMSTASRP